MVSVAVQQKGGDAPQTKKEEHTSFGQQDFSPITQDPAGYAVLPCTSFYSNISMAKPRIGLPDLSFAVRLTDCIPRFQPRNLLLKLCMLSYSKNRRLRHPPSRQRGKYAFHVCLFCACVFSCYSKTVCRHSQGVGHISRIFPQSLPFYHGYCTASLPDQILKIALSIHGQTSISVISKTSQPSLRLPHDLRPSNANKKQS